MIVFVGLWALISTLLIYEFGTVFDNGPYGPKIFYKIIVWVGCICTSFAIAGFFCMFLSILVGAFLGAAL